MILLFIDMHSLMEVIMTDKNETYKVYENNDTGNVYIADHVVASIAGIAAMGVEGVATPYEASISRKLFEKGKNKILPKKTKVVIQGQTVYINMSINVIYGYNVLEVSNTVQKKVVESIESMTGMSVMEANIDVAAIEVNN